MTAPGAILLAGGRARRLDGAVKPLLEVGGRTLLRHAVAAAQAAACTPITVVADPLDPDLDVAWVREDPPFSGPAAAVVTALASWTDPAPEWTLLLACDLPRAEDAVAQLLTDLPLLPPDTAGVCLADAGGRPQWLTGLYRTSVLRNAARTLSDGGRDLPMRALLEDATVAVIRDRSGGSTDVDTWEDLSAARRAAADTADSRTDFASEDGVDDEH